MARAGRVAVGELVDQQNFRVLLQRAIKIKLRQPLVAVTPLNAGELRQAGEQCGGLWAAMRLHPTRTHRVPSLQRLLRSAEHGVGFSNAGAGTEIDAQFAALRSPRLGLHLGQQIVRIGPGIKRGIARRAHRRQAYH